MIALLFLSSEANCQSVKDIKKLEAANQRCLDSGMHMLHCSAYFNYEMDSMLNLVYEKLINSLDNNGKIFLKTEQKNWLKKRDSYFKKEDTGFNKRMKSGEDGPDMYMIVYDDKADFVKRRVLQLIDRLIKKSAR